MTDQVDQPTQADQPTRSDQLDQPTGTPARPISRRRVLTLGAAGLVLAGPLPVEPPSSRRGGPGVSGPPPLLPRAVLGDVGGTQHR